MTTGDIQLPGAAPAGSGFQIVEVDGKAYVEVDASLLTDDLGISTVKAMERMVPPPDLPQPPPPGFILVDMDTFIKTGLAAGALTGVSQAGSGYQIDTETFALSINNNMHKLITAVLTSWSDALAEQKEESDAAAKKADLKKSDIKHDLQTNEIRKGKIDTFKAYGSFVASGQATQPVFVMGSLAIGVPAVTSFVSGTSDNSALSLTVGAITDLGGAVANPVLNFMASSLMYGVQVFANMGGLGVKEGAIDKKVPEEYGKKTLALVTSKDSDVILGAAAGPGKNGAELVAMTKAVMLALPLMLSYRVETGGANLEETQGMTSQEMRSLLLQEFKDIPKDDIKAQLASTMQFYLGQISPPVRELLLNRLDAYIDSKPPLGDLLDGRKAIRNISTVAESSIDDFHV